MTEHEARELIDGIDDRLTELFWEARRADDRIIRIVAARATMGAMDRHDGGLLDIGKDLAFLIYALMLSFRDYGIGWVAIRVECQRMRRAVALYILACCRLGSIDPVLEYMYSGRPQSRLGIVPAP